MPSILVVNARDDERRALAEALAARGARVGHAGTIDEALTTLGREEFEHVVTVRTLPDGSGELLAQRAREVSPRTRIVRVTNFTEVRGPSDILRFDFTDYILDVDDLSGLLSGADTAPGVGQRALVDCFVRTVEAVVGLLELSDPLTVGNAASAMRLADGVAAEMGLPDERRQEVALAALLHDIGNFAIRPGVLAKPGALTPAEEVDVRQHAERGVQLLDHIDFPWKVKPIIRHHHERYDGSGYPDGKKGRAIPVGARILAVVDAYLGMTARRPHRETIEHDTALAQIRRGVGTQFDPEIVEAFAAFVARRQRLAGDAFQVKILVVRGSGETMPRLKLHFLREEFQVVAADSVEAAIEAVPRENIRFVVADVTGRWGEAVALLEALRERLNRSQTDLLLLDAEATRERRMAAIDHGAEEVYPADVAAPEIVSRMRRILRKEESLRRSGTLARDKEGIEGDLAQFPLSDILQMLGLGQKTARVLVETAAGEGRIFLETGRITHAEAPGSQGRTALDLLLALRAGRFRITHGITVPQRTIDRDAMAVLLENLRQVDEQDRDAARPGA